MKTILVLGKGYISSKIEKYWSLEKDEYRLIRVSRSEFDYIRQTEFGAMLRKYEYDIHFIVNTCGFTGNPNVDACELNEDECYKVNVDYNEIILQNCNYYGINMINVSTGCLYNDESGRVFAEDDLHNFGIKNPSASIYSKSKSKFENLYEYYSNYHILNINSYLLRIRMPFDDEMDDKNYINKIIKYDKLINYPNSVTYIPDLVGFIETIITKSVPKGIYNVVNKNPITAEKVIAIWNEFEGNNKQIDRWYSVDDLLSLGLMKCRRSNCVLSTEKIEKYYPELQYSGTAVIKAIRDNLERNK